MKATAYIKHCFGWELSQYTQVGDWTYSLDASVCPFSGAKLQHEKRQSAEQRVHEGARGEKS